MQFTPTYKYLLLSLGSLMVCAAGVGYAAYTLYTGQDILREQISQIQQTQAQAAAFIQLRRLAEQSEVERKTLQALILTQQNDAIVPLTLIEEQWATELGVVAEASGITTRSEADRHWLVINYSLSGTAKNVRALTQLLEQLPYVSTLTTLSIRDDMRGETTAALTVEIALQQLES